MFSRCSPSSGYDGALAMEFLPATDEAIRAGREWVQARLSKVP